MLLLLLLLLLLQLMLLLLLSAERAGQCLIDSYPTMHSALAHSVAFSQKGEKRSSEWWLFTYLLHRLLRGPRSNNWGHGTAWHAGSSVARQIGEILPTDTDAVRVASQPTY